MTDGLNLESGVLTTFTLYFSALALYGYSNVPSYFTVIKDPFNISTMKFYVSSFISISLCTLKLCLNMSGSFVLDFTEGSKM